MLRGIHSSLAMGPRCHLLPSMGSQGQLGQAAAPPEPSTEPGPAHGSLDIHRVMAQAKNELHGTGAWMGHAL